jgi:YbbR domain-containing protein
MTRLVGAIVYNWPLKLLAVLLATLLYAGLVVSQSSFELPTAIPVRAVNQPTDAVLLGTLPSVSRIRYVANGDIGAGPTPDSFRATVDLADVDPAAGSTYVKIDVESVDPRFLVIGYEPQGVNVQLDPFTTYQVPVTVDMGTPPSGLEVGSPELSTSTVSVSGPESVVKFVVAARADVAIDPSGFFIDRDVPLIAVDQLGNPLSPVRVDPVSVRVRIAVYINSNTKPLAVNPVVTGTPPAGYEIASITVTPLTISVKGDPAALSSVVRADTENIPIGGATGGIDADVALDLPANIEPSQATVHVTIVLRAQTGTRAFDAAVVVTGGEAGLRYLTSVNTVRTVIGGPIADLTRIDASQFTVAVDVSGLAPGTHEVVPAPNLQAGLRLLSVEPATVTVTVEPLGSAAPASSGG